MLRFNNYSVCRSLQLGLTTVTFVKYIKAKVEILTSQMKTILVISAFLSRLADQSNRPESMLTVTSAAISCLLRH